MNSNTLLYRQAHPNFAPDKVPSSQVFMPNSEDQGKMSVYDGDQITPLDSYFHYTTIVGRQSNGVWGLTCAEVGSHSVPASPAPLVNFPSHAIVDFNGKSEKEARKIAKLLKAIAIKRGCLHSPS